MAWATGSGLFSAPSDVVVVPVVDVLTDDASPMRLPNSPVSESWQASSEHPPTTDPPLKSPGVAREPSAKTMRRVRRFVVVESTVNSI